MSAQTKTLVNLFSQPHTLAWSLIFLIPFCFNQNQILTGTLVNTILLISASRIEPKYLLPLAVLPSLAAVFHGLLFGPFTVYLVYFLPFIWLGNYFLLYFKSPVIAIIFKVGLLFLVANLFVSFHLVPQIFLTAMGGLQLLTAILGLTISLAYDRYRNL